MSQIIKTEQGFDVLDDDGEIIGKGFSDEFLSNYSEASDEQGLSVLCPFVTTNCILMKQKICLYA